MWGGGGMWVRSDVTSGRNRRWEWRPDAGDAEDGKTTSDASGRGARPSDAGLIFADADGKVRQWFPILSAWIADDMENVTLHGLKTNACPKSEVPTHELGTNARSHRTRDYAR